MRACPDLVRRDLAFQEQGMGRDARFTTAIGERESRFSE